MAVSLSCIWETWDFWQEIESPNWATRVKQFTFKKSIIWKNGCLCFHIKWCCKFIENASIYVLYNKTLSLKYSIIYLCLYFVYFCISISFFQHDLVFACNLYFNYRSRLNLVRFSVSRKNSRLQTINDTFFYFISLKRYQNFKDFISNILKEKKTFFSFDSIDMSILLWYFLSY